MQQFQKYTVVQLSPRERHRKAVSRSIISAFVVQVKNNNNFNAQPDTILFDLMNIFLVCLFDMDKKATIRIVFAPGSPIAAVEPLRSYFNM